MKLIEQIFATLELVKFFEKIEGRTRFQKLVFLLDQKINMEFDFKKSHFGPFSGRLYEIIDTMKKDGLMNEELVENGERSKYIYSLTPKGEEVLENTEKSVKDANKIKGEIKKIEEINTFSLENLVKYVYETYPDFAGDFFKEN
ncbi:MAG: helix-turn-helix transcriptional regulator [Candidatus Aenigmarchaeota archaeon]|nr:helix-turn-helix transcriptional regulator [Candidatus Aenigmarchaeota archaeon]